MQIVIEISEDIYAEKDKPSFSNKATLEILQAVRNGIPLPEGHGRLGDLSELEERISGFISHDENIVGEKIVSREKFILDGIKDTPTIIEADKEDENGD